MLGISLDTWVKIAAIVIAGVVVIAFDKADRRKWEKEAREDRRKHQAEVEEDRRKRRAKAEEKERKHQAALREILARRLAEDDSPQESAR